MELVFVESPYAGDVARNEKYARLAMRDCIQRGEAPYASHLLYTQPYVLDDLVPEERKLGIEAGFEFAKVCARSVFYIDFGLSKGMLGGVENAVKAGRLVEYRKLPAVVFQIHFPGETSDATAEGFESVGH